MARIDPVPDTASVERIAEPHLSTVAAIVRAAERGLFTEAQAQHMIDRVRAHLIAPPITGPTASPSFVTDHVFPDRETFITTGRIGAPTEEPLLTDHPAPVATPHPTERLLTVTAHSALPATTVLTVRGEVDAFTSPYLTDQLLPHVRGAVAHVIVDLTGVTFFSAAGLTVLLTAGQAAVTAGVTLRLVASTRPVLRPLMLTGLDGRFDISADVTSVLSRAGSGPDG